MEGKVNRVRWGVAGVVGLLGVLLLPAGADAGRAITGPCRTEFCAGVSPDGSRVVFPFEEELTEGADERQIYERSAGKTRPLLPPEMSYWPRLDEVSADANHVFVTTNLSLAPEDTDGFGIDVFDISAEAITLISTGPFDGAGGAFASFMGASPDGTRAFFDVFGPPPSASACPGLYQRAGGQTTRVAFDPDPPEPPLCSAVKFGGVSADGSHLFFASEAELEAGDEREEDIYQQVGDVFTRLTTYPEPAGTCIDLVKFADASSDGRTVLFSTNSPVVPEDTDSTADVYKRRPDGTFVLVSRATDGGNEQCGFGGDRPVALSADGGTAIFETAARLSSLDVDSSADLYSANDNGAVELLSTGPADAGVDGRPNNIFPDWLALASDDAQGVAFETHHRLVAADRDTSIDVYLRAGGQTELISAGLLGKPVKSNAELLDISGDGRAIVFTTKEALAPRDLDHERDVYLRRADRERSVLLSGETIAPQMRIAKRGRLLQSGRVSIALSCPKSEASGPCRGRLALKRGRNGLRIGGASFRVVPGSRVRVPVRLRHRVSVPKSPFVRVRGIDALGNVQIVTQRIRITARSHSSKRPGR
jgi:hypothetical protein